MTALEYMGKQVQRYRRKYCRALERKAPKLVLMRIAMIMRYYEIAADALQKVWKQDG
jgi:hypothetical protein